MYTDASSTFFEYATDISLSEESTPVAYFVRLYGCGNNTTQVHSMPQGKVKWFSIDKGYGFIEPDDGSPDVFVHKNNVDGLGWDEGLRDGDEVEYEVERTPKGLSALNVKLT